MDHDPESALESAEHFARHVSDVMESVATLLDQPRKNLLDLGLVPQMFAECPSCTIEALLYLAVCTFDGCKWDGARLREEIPTLVSAVLAADVQ